MTTNENKYSNNDNNDYHNDNNHPTTRQVDHEMACIAAIVTKQPRP